MIKPQGKTRRQKMTSTKKLTKATKDTVIGDVVEANPRAREVIVKYFGNGCFTCPGMKVESISFGSMMHNVEPEQLLKEINEALKEDN
jgi:hybrid cluster-associated redox disulfide protein